ncbi:TRAP transporter large permease subunit [Marinovum sp. 2_MG-2023]|uniref:TRAP transporter large permease n=1 Tax=unclassified Marinovum TaxID=2647166 RepID=UPI0026E17E2A|nr:MULTISPECIES: TRAP transporter large permease subunit [unclassified Marinovum]MDO6729235.1 TRAP transporter large permease subunit [Marinovum sp. 2_MG-2023]MDO6779138.1 TRAP transporter large permease subunit [Marinovum sp. 1_MG-2023]
MTESLAILIFVGSLFSLLALGVWVGAALLTTAAIGLALFTSRPIGDSMALTIWGEQSSWTLTALPLFIWMGEILFRTKLSETLFRGLAPFMRKLPGGLLHVNIGASAIFAAISGSSAATVATVGKMSIPELRRRKYPEHMIIGTLSGAGTLGLLIPPSIAMIVFGVTVNESISKLFMAAMIPGLVLALCFMVYVIAWSLLNKGTFNPIADVDTSGMGRRLLDLLPVLCLIMAVIGSIYTGIATATEASALGVFGAIVLSAVQRTLSIETLKESIMGSVRTTAMIMMILMGAGFLSLAMGFTGIPRALAEGIETWDLSPVMLIVILTLFYIVLGCFLDGLSSIVLTMAVIEPMVRAAGFDMLWFGVYVMIVVEMAQITPPIGFNLFVLQGMTGRDMGFIGRASFPMFLVMAAFIVLLFLFPAMATWLPEALSK